MRKPTGEECNGNVEVAPGCFATWYPQMGGYTGAALVFPSWDQNEEEPGCFRVLVWHDGEFPFDDSGEREPASLHHCDPEQFHRFADEVENMSRRVGGIEVATYDVGRTVIKIQAPELKERIKDLEFDNKALAADVSRHLSEVIRLKQLFSVLDREERAGKVVNLRHLIDQALGYVRR